LAVRVIEDLLIDIVIMNVSAATREPACLHHK